MGVLMVVEMVEMKVATKGNQWVDVTVDLMVVRLVHWLVALLADWLVYQTDEHWVEASAEWKVVKMVSMMVCYLVVSMAVLLVRQRAGTKAVMMVGLKVESKAEMLETMLHCRTALIEQFVRIVATRFYLSQSYQLGLSPTENGYSIVLPR